MKNCFASTKDGKIKGSINHGIFQFHRIPYAKPPVGPLRFRMPQPTEPWDGEYDGTFRGNIAPQGPSDLDIPMGPTLGTCSEDCLTLAVSTPSLNGHLPVAVWFHGGANCYGAGDLDWYDGASLARSEQIVVVNLNYRLGPFGFFCYPGVCEETLNIEDQIMALHWIQENISNFGGDPNRVTLFGQSAGGNAIAHLLSRPDTEGLFHQVIMESASLGRGHHTMEDAFEVGNAMLKELNIHSQNPTDILEELQAKTADEILLAADSIPNELRTKHQMMIFKPVKTQWHTPDQTVEALKKEAIRRKTRIIMGFTVNEMRAFIPGKDEESLTLAKNIQEQRYDQPGKKFVNAASEGGCHVWKYRFAWKAPESDYDSCHCLELPFLFGNLDTWDAPMLKGAGREEMLALQQTMQSLWGTFFRFEEFDSAVWPRYNTSDKFVKCIDNITNLPISEE
ncbi:MAG: carboxylesterase family protein [Eubacteriales bacterium]|nr:carboxylesterase family protein [Eubacteriales bacterium]